MSSHLCHYTAELRNPVGVERRTTNAVRKIYSGTQNDEMRCEKYRTFFVFPYYRVIETQVSV